MKALAIRMMLWVWLFFFFFLSRKGKFVDEERVIGHTRDPSTTRIFGLVTPVSRPVATNSFLPRENTIGSIKVATFH